MMITDVEDAVITLEEKTTLVGVSELREKLDAVIGKMREGTVVLEKRRKPIAVILSPEKYREMERLLDLAEEYVLGSLAREREKRSGDGDFLALDVVEKRLGMK